MTSASRRYESYHLVELVGANTTVVSSYLRVEAHREQHDEEDERPQLRDGQTRQRLGVGDETQSRTCVTVRGSSLENIHYVVPDFKTLVTVYYLT